MKNYKPQEFAEMLGVTVKTLQRWDRGGQLTANRTPTDRRYYTHSQYVEYMGLNQQIKGKTIIYTRVSNIGQKDDLKDQVEFLRQYANAKGMIVDEVLEDVGSGLNYDRKKWNKLIGDCVKGEVKIILIAHKDRFIRFGYHWFERFLKTYGAEIIVVNNETLSPEEEMIQDLIAIIHVFSCRIYGLRKYKSKIKEDEGLCEPTRRKSIQPKRKN